MPRRQPLHWICALTVVAMSAGGWAAAAQSTAPQEPKRSSTKNLTLVGCIGDADPNGQPMFSDVKHKTMYRLTGQDLREYAGHRVEIVGAAPKRVQVVGGLTPSPNVAAQAGAIDPSKAAIANAPGGGPSAGSGNVQLPEFRVRSIRQVGGNCPER
jgi:hypothetical protein